MNVESDGRKRDPDGGIRGKRKSEEEKANEAETEEELLVCAVLERLNSCWFSVSVYQSIDWSPGFLIRNRSSW